MNISAISTISAILESAEFTIAGRAGQEPEVRFFDGGKSVARLNIAVNNGKDAEPHWFKVEAWDQLASQLVDTCSKGSLVVATGRVTTKSWQNKQGEDRMDLIIKAREIKVVNKNTATEPAAPAEELPF